MPTTASQFFDLYCSKYSTDPLKDELIASARTTLSKCYYGSQYEQAVGLYACHEISLIKDTGRGSGEPGSFSSKNEGDLSVGFSNSSVVAKDDPYFSQTIWGLKLMNLKRSKLRMGVTGGYITGCNP